MPSSAWTYSNWSTYDPGSTSRLTQLRLHVQEVADVLKKGSYTVEGRAWSAAEIRAYYETLLKSLSTEEAASSVSSERRTYFTRGRVI